MPIAKKETDYLWIRVGSIYQFLLRRFFFAIGKIAFDWLCDRKEALEDIFFFPIKRDFLQERIVGFSNICHDRLCWIYLYIYHNKWMQSLDLMSDKNAFRMMILLYSVSCRIEYFYSVWLMRKNDSMISTGSNPLFLLFYLLYSFLYLNCDHIIRNSLFFFPWELFFLRLFCRSFVRLF
jgi:hypothetical protein